MQDQKLLNKVITISAEETKQTQYGLVKKIKDEKNLTYSVFQSKRDGSESEAWKQYKELDLGDTVQIGYVEEDKEYEGKKYIARTIRNFNKDIGNGVQNYQGSQSKESPRSGQNMKPSDGLRDDLIIRQVAFKGVIELMASQIIVEADVEKSVHKWTDKFSRIIKAQELANPLSQPSELEEELPTIQQGEDISVEDIPF
jgi:hypothetical protein